MWQYTTLGWQWFPIEFTNQGIPFIKPLINNSQSPVVNQCVFRYICGSAIGKRTRSHRKTTPPPPFRQTQIQISNSFLAGFSTIRICLGYVCFLYGNKHLRLVGRWEVLFSRKGVIRNLFPTGLQSIPMVCILSHSLCL